MSTALSLDDTAGKPPLALIAGPTASGKSELAFDLAFALARRSGLQAVVINADSAQVYRDLPILSAGPDDTALNMVPHRLYGEWDGATACSAAEWAQRATGIVADTHGKGGVPILVGGTGLYIRTLLDGIAPVPEIDPGVRKAVRALGVGESHAALKVEDPERAAALASNDVSRIARALEVVRSTGRTLADWQTERLGGIGNRVALHPLILLPERRALYARCDQRFARMLEDGALAEVEALLARDLDPALPVMRAIGVREIAGYLRGQWSLEEARTRGQQATRNYAKRQYTWFRHQPPPAWPRYDPAPDWHADGMQNYDPDKIFETLFHT